MIGSEEHARHILAYERGDVAELRENWRFIGSGTTRHCYLGPDGVVYKVGCQDANSREAESAEYLREQFDEHSRYYIPLTNLYYDGAVVAMEYCGSDTPGFTTANDEGCDFYEEIEEEVGVGDLFEGNVRVLPDGRIAIIDMGYFA